MSHTKGDDLAEAAPFTVSIAWDVLWAACPVAGLNGDRARLIRFGENALFHLPADNVVVRIARCMDYWGDATKEVDVARWLATIHFPAAQVYDVRQPAAIGGHPVTFWCFIAGRPGDRRDIATLGTVLRRLHATPRPTTFLLPHENILGRVRQRINAARVPLADKSFLTQRLSHLQADLSSLRFPLQPTPTHGDAHTENLIISHDGRPVLIDFERFAWANRNGILR